MPKWLGVWEKYDNRNLLNLMQPGGIGILSARCCNPAAAIQADEQLMQNLKEAMDNVGMDSEVYFETISGAQKSLPTLMGKLDNRQSALVNKVAVLFMSKGLSVFPMLLLKGDIAFYGGVPSVEIIQEKLAEMQKT